MGKKPDAAMAAANGAVPKVRMVLQYRVQSDLILTNKRVGAIVLVPILRKGENLLEAYDEKPRFSVMMRSLDTPSSYLLDAKASRGRTRFFYSIASSVHQVIHTNDPFHFFSQQNAATKFKRLLGKKKGSDWLIPFFFPSSDSI